MKPWLYHGILVSQKKKFHFRLREKTNAQRDWSMGSLPFVPLHDDFSASRDSWLRAEEKWNETKN